MFCFFTLCDVVIFISICNPAVWSHEFSFLISFLSESKDDQYNDRK